MGIPPTPKTPLATVVNNNIVVNLEEVSDIYGPVYKYKLTSYTHNGTNVEYEGSPLYSNFFNVTVIDITPNVNYSFVLEAYTSEVLKSTSNMSNGVLLVKNSNFAINTMNNTSLPHLNFLSHNFGFGLIIITAVILGTYNRSWKFRLISLACAWLFLLFTQASLLVMGAYSYKLAFSDAKIGWGFSMFVEIVHIIVTILPIIVSVLWLMIPFQSRRLQNKKV